jgi:molybdopterin/thiamine biosynthesis adenylyltransferase
LRIPDGSLILLYPRRDKGGRDHGIVVIGVGGLGAAAATELAASGTARLGLVDGDCVELSNLHRQLLHAPSDVARPKAEVAAKKLRALFPKVEIEVRVEQLTTQNAEEVLEGYDLAIDATDNAAAKFALNDACVDRGMPLVHAGVIGFGGQVLTVVPHQTACLRCLFPEAPDDDEVASCSRAGILGPLAAVVGTLEAREALAFVTGGEVRSAGRLLTLDVRALRPREIPLRRSATCPACGTFSMVGRSDARVGGDAGFKETR